MATPKELVRVVSEITGVPAATVEVIDRALMTAGFRSKAKRGRGLAEVSNLDAACLTLACLVSSSPKDAVRNLSNMEYEIVDLSDILEDDKDHLIGYAFEMSRGDYSVSFNITAKAIRSISTLMHK